MIPISRQEFLDLLAKNEISIALPETNTGRQLIFGRHNKRTIIIHLLDSDACEYIAQVLHLLFDIETTWFVFPRYGEMEKIVKIPLSTNEYPERVSTANIEQLVNELISIQKNYTVIETDPYLIAGSGEIIAVWDHHVISDGFTVSFSNIKKSTLFIGTLNELGVEFNVLYSDV